jgi:hypothetical protein
MAGFRRRFLFAVAVACLPVSGWSQSATGTPAASVSPASLTFAATAIGGNTLPQLVTVTNSGSGQLRVTGATLSGSAANDFRVGNTCKLPLSKNQRCAISLAFRPSVAGVREATLNIATSDKTLSVKLSGSTSSGAPKIEMSPASLAFGSVNVGSSGSAQKITLTNSGDADFSVGALRAGGDDAFDFQLRTTCESKLSAGKSCDINVAFAPKSPGEKTAFIAVAGSSPGNRVSTKMSGTGVGSKLVVSNLRLAFAEQATGTSSAPQSVTLSNGGNAALSFGKISLAGPNAGDFVQSNTCTSGLAPGANCVVTVVYKPTVAGPKNAAISVTGNFGTAPALIAVWADGQRPMKGGLWRGKDPVSGKGMLALIAENGSSNFIREDGVQYFGPTVIKGELFEAALAVASVDALQGSVRLAGKINQGTSITARLVYTPKLGKDQTGDLSLAFDSAYRNSSALEKVAGNFKTSTGAILNISASGVVFAQDATTGCVINGAVSMIDPRFNAYGVKLAFTNCKGSLASRNATTALGLLSLDDSGKTPRVVIAAQTLRPGYAVSFTADRQ